MEPTRRNVPIDFVIDFVNPDIIQDSHGYPLPVRGRSRTGGLVQMPHRWHYVIFYTAETRTVLVHRMLRSARDYRALL